MLVLFAYTGDTENLERYAAFNNQMGLPVTLEQVGLSEADIPALCEYAHATNEWKQGNPEPFTDEKFAAAIKAPTLTATRSRTDPKPPQMGRAPFWWFLLIQHSVRTRTRFFTRKVRVRFLFIGNSAEGLLGTANRNEQRQGIIVVMVSCLLFCGIKVALCELDRHLYSALMAIASYVHTGSLYTSGKA